MFDMQLPWWEFIVRAAIVYAVLLVLVRISGKRTVGQFTPFDLVVVMLLAEAVTESLSGGDESLVGGLIVAVTLIVLDIGLAIAGARSKKFDKVIQGEPVLVGRDGEIYKEVLKREKVAEEDLDKALRENDCQLEDMRMAVLEVDGQISILKREPREKRQPQPA
jgi:uncharacterized membrane protein YcaP (DUF421 family)